MTDFAVKLNLEEANAIVDKIIVLIGPAHIEISSKVTISTDNDKAARLMAILFDQAPESSEKKIKAKKMQTEQPKDPQEIIKVAAGSIVMPAPASLPAVSQRAPHSIISLPNGADDGKSWDLLDAERNVINSFSNEEKNSNLQLGYFDPGMLLRYRKNGTVRQVVGAPGKVQKLEPVKRG